MIDMQHPLAVLAVRLAWARIEAALASKFTHQDRPARQEVVGDLLGEHAVEFGGGVSNAGRPRLPIRLMVSLLYLKNAFDLSDEELVQRWSENVVWQFFSAMDYYEPRLPCDATQIGRFRGVLGEAGVEQLLKTTIETAVNMKAIALTVVRCPRTVTLFEIFDCWERKHWSWPYRAGCLSLLTPPA